MTGEQKGTDLSETMTLKPRHRGKFTESSSGIPTWLTAAFLLLVVMVPTVIAYFVGASGAAMYAARSEVLFVATTSNSTADDQAMATQVALMTSRPVVAAVAEQYDLSVEELSDAVTAERVDRSQMLRLTVEDGDPARAVEITESLTEAILARSAGRSPQAGQEEAYLSGRIAELQQRLSQEGAGTGSQQLVLEQLIDLQARLTDLQLPPEPAIEPLTAAYELPDPVGPQPVRSAAAGAIVGIVLAALTVVALLARRRSADR
ncbi:hypothetical protein [Modestobacter sp. VKM Ac-2985]|uniref:hypothetical protein n=1 Tax=Modestobacter sp. VKM Ac-2985 TaxID=3004139 RepID=UPI0022AB5CEF|nr:hypothetical protein [Modestobacter sp. VKM Ac-2985]MCZ2836042.1 hypothetical protein [Modestobacter sp. VKM Ac-2985]